jgi:HAD superfamily hydrolase (TIGR01484 family)
VKPQALATDLDGTLLPLDGNEQNLKDLWALRDELEHSRLKLLFVTGRHFASVAQIMHQLPLPTPDWIVGDVGTSIYVRSSSGYELLPDYASQLDAIIGNFTVAKLADALSCIDGLKRQEDEKQSRFKLSYYVDANLLSACVARVADLLERTAAPYSYVSSVDPFNGVGLLDLLPHQVTKAFALDWWSAHAGYPHPAIIYAGDSGNDSAVFASGYRSIVVSNAASAVLSEAQQAHMRAGWENRLFAASLPATSGVLAGLRYYLEQ